MVATDDDHHKRILDGRMIAWVLYMIAYGLMFEISIFYARYLRRFEEHDEVHATLIIMAFTLAIIQDLYYYLYVEAIERRQDNNYWISLALTITINSLVLLQILFGTYIREQMRSPKRTSSNYYYISKSVHKWSGYVVSFVTKAKLLAISFRVNEDLNNKIVTFVCVFYIICLVLQRLIGDQILRFGNKWF